MWTYDFLPSENLLLFLKSPAQFKLARETYIILELNAAVTKPVSNKSFTQWIKQIYYRYEAAKKLETDTSRIQSIPPWGMCFKACSYFADSQVCSLWLSTALTLVAATKKIWETITIK